MKIQARSKSAQGHFRLGKFLGNAWQSMEVTKKELATLQADARIEVREDLPPDMTEKQNEAEMQQQIISEEDYELGQ